MGLISIIETVAGLQGGIGALSQCAASASREWADPAKRAIALALQVAQSSELCAAVRDDLVPLAG